MAWRDFLRLDRSDVGRAYVAIHRSILALAETGHFTGEPRVDSLHCSKGDASERIRRSNVAFAPRRGLHDKSQTVDTDPLLEYLGCLRICGCHGRISPNVRPVSRRFGQGYHDR